ncbi:MAG: thioredoxin-disulfide reductase [Candidatus Omnitrophota bacterium]
MNNLFDSVIIGAGPAGLTAALYAARARLNIKIFEANSIGGQLILTDRINNYPGFPQGIESSELALRIKDQLRTLGVEVIAKKVEKVEKLADKKGKHIFKINCTDEQLSTRSIIIASGASPKRLDIPGEKEFAAKGVSYCAICDAPLFKGKTVTVIGGGNAAVEEAIFLSRFVKKLYLVHRRDSLRATAILQEQLNNISNCKIIFSAIPVRILGEGRVSALEIKNLKDNKLTQIVCEGVFIFIGQIPNTDLVKSIVNLDEFGYIITDKRMQTTEAGIFACGDCIAKDLRQVITAASDGALAAYWALNYLYQP